MKLNFRIWLENFSIPNDVAYWISPSGEITGTQGVKHISNIIQSPERFGFTNDQIEAIHKELKERPGQEGEARDLLMIDALKRGWIRIRKRNYPDYYSIQYAENRTTHRRLTNWVLDMFNAGHVHSNTELRLIPIDNNPKKVLSVKEYLRYAVAA
jgi:hypothetical protein